MKKHVPILILILITCSYSKLKADCMACWKLKYVEIENIHGEISKGYMQWNNSWASYSQHTSKKDFSGASDFCDTITAYFTDKYDRLVLSNDIVFNRKLFGKTAIAVGRADTINVNEIRNVFTPKNEHNDTDGAGFMPRITKTQSELITQTKSIAMYKTSGWGLSDAYYISYDPTIREEELIEIAKNRNEESKFDDKVILIEIHYD